MENEVKHVVEMTAEEAAKFEEFRAEQRLKETAAKAKADREAYRTLVDEAIAAAMPRLKELSEKITSEKRGVMDCFRNALKLKNELFGVTNNQQTHTFTNSEGTARIMLGRYFNDDYTDTVSEGIAIVKEYIESLARDDASRALVRAILRLLARDQSGALKASRVLQLRKMAEEGGNERFIEGVRIIEESYNPSASKEFIRLSVKTGDGAWQPVALGMTEAASTQEKEPKTHSDDE